MNLKRLDTELVSILHSAIVSHIVTHFMHEFNVQFFGYDTNAKQIDKIHA